jgi:hypothetical protein
MAALEASINAAKGSKSDGGGAKAKPKAKAKSGGTRKKAAAKS